MRSAARVARGPARGRAGDAARARGAGRADRRAGGARRPRRPRARWSSTSGSTAASTALTHNQFLVATLEEYYVLALRIWFLALEQPRELEQAVLQHRGLLEAIRRRRRGAAERTHAPSTSTTSRPLDPARPHCRGDASRTPPPPGCDISPAVSEPTVAEGERCRYRQRATVARARQGGRDRRRHRRQQPRLPPDAARLGRRPPARQGAAPEPGRLDRPRLELHLPGRPLARDDRSSRSRASASTGSSASSRSAAGSRSRAREERMQELAAPARPRRRPGASTPSRLLTPAEVKELVPYIDESVILGGFYTPGVAVVDSLRAGTIMRERGQSSRGR